MTDPQEDSIDQLARQRGLGEAYYTHDGQLKYFSRESRLAVLKAMGVGVQNPREVPAPQSVLQREAVRKCYEPAILTEQKLWGLSIQLYTLRSSRNWGIGDFRDLCDLIELVAPLGCDSIGLNPLHALFPAAPEHASPYSPSSRLFLNVLYIAIEDVPEFSECAAAQAQAAQPSFQAALAAVRSADNVAYTEVAALKLRALRLLHTHFRERQLERSSERKGDRAREFETFVNEGGDALRLHAVFDALDAHFHKRGIVGWRSWPSKYRDVHSTAVKRFADEHSIDIEFYLFLQWLADEQLAWAQHHARERGMRIGLYGDLAVGANPNGSEVWSNQALYVQDVSVGAPPDPLALSGQDWGIPPIDPNALRDQAFAPFATLLRANMRRVGALRIDHVMSLFRLWWVPKDLSAIDGVYVHYPLDDLVCILANESERARCLVIGEDLGTVPDEVREAMERGRLYHYKVLLFEKFGERFKAPHEYTRAALATATTHDLPPLKAWWQGDDLHLRDQLKLYPSPDTAERLHRERETDRYAMVRALCAAGLWYWREHEPLPEFSFALARALHLYLGESQAALVLLQLEDLIGMTDPINVPGTHTEHANWQRKMVVETREIFARAEVLEMLGALCKARSGLDPNRQ